MKNVYASKYRIYCEDNLKVLSKLKDNCIDSIVTDPPYGLNFMEKKWDAPWNSAAKKSKRTHTYGDQWKNAKCRLCGNFSSKDPLCKCEEPDWIVENKTNSASMIAYQQWATVWAEELLRVAKPGAHILVFGGTRTFHRITSALEDAGWEVRDTMMWAYGQGFPKNRDISKDIDKKLKSKRKVVGKRKQANAAHGSNSWNREWEITKAATKEAKKWKGWGTALKPAWEPIVLARKPLAEKNIAENVLKYGTGGLNIDKCRIATDELKSGTSKRGKGGENSLNCSADGSLEKDFYYDGSKGRFPANLAHDGSEEVKSLFPTANSSRANGNLNNPKHGSKNRNPTSYDWNPERESHDYRDTGSAARFFYCPKASSKDRNEGLENAPDRTLSRSCSAQAQENKGTPRKISKGGFNKTFILKNNHPTVKPTELMKYLVRLVTPPGGIVLDPFMGSGSTGKAALLEGALFIGIDSHDEYVEIAKHRLKHAAETTFTKTSKKRFKIKL